MKAEGELACFGTMYPHPVMLDGITFPSVENAYQSKRSGHAHKEFESVTPEEAARLGDEYPEVEGWADQKEEVLYELLLEKFKDPILKTKLVKIRGRISDDMLGNLLQKVRCRYRDEILHFNNYMMTEKDLRARKQIMAYSRRISQMADDQYHAMMERMKDHPDSEAVPEDELLMIEDDSLMHLYMDGCGDQYVAMAQEINRRGFKHVIDIGANTGYQCLHFHAYGIHFVGVDVAPHPCKTPPPCVMKRIKFPAELHEEIEFDRENTVCISSLCVGFFDPIREMLEQIAKDFKHSLIEMPYEARCMAKEIFDDVEVLEDNLVWLTKN